MNTSFSAQPTKRHRNSRWFIYAIAIAWVIFFGSIESRAAENITHPFRGVTYIVRSESAPRALKMHIVRIDLRAKGLRFELTPPEGPMETIRSTAVEFLKREHAQIAINAHFFLPFPSTSPYADLVGFAVSNGRVYSAFEHPKQSFAIVNDAPAINIDRNNKATLVHDDTRFADGKHVREKAKLWNAVAGSAQIVTDGHNTVPSYADAKHPNALLTANGPSGFSNTNSWYEKLRARTAIGLSKDRKSLYLFTVDAAGGSLGMTVTEVADLLIRDYGVYSALNLDGGGSTSMAMENPSTHSAELVNVSSDRKEGRSVGSNFAVFAAPEP